jgi:hypothetical protein
MLRDFNWKAFVCLGPKNQPGFWLRIAIPCLAVANLVAFVLYLFPPGGARAELFEQTMRLQSQIGAVRRHTARLQTVSGKVQIGARETSDFKNRFILPKRLAYGQVIAEVQRMSKLAGLQERDGVFSEEPIEGTADLSLLNMTANYLGSYDNLIRFLHEADHSPMLLMLDNLQAAPQLRGDQIDVAIRFQAIIVDRVNLPSGAEP